MYNSAVDAAVCMRMCMYKYAVCSDSYRFSSRFSGSCTDGSLHPHAHNRHMCTYRGTDHQHIRTYNQHNTYVQTYMHMKWQETPPKRQVSNSRGCWSCFASLFGRCCSSRVADSSANGKSR